MLAQNNLPVSAQFVSPFFQNQSETYFRTSDVTPFFEDGAIKMYSGRSKQRSWGSCSVRSTIEALSSSVIKVTVTGWHKHTVSPVGGNYYFVNEGGSWVRRTANHKVVKAALAKN